MNQQFNKRSGGDSLNEDIIIEVSGEGSYADVLFL